MNGSNDAFKSNKPRHIDMTNFVAAGGVIWGVVVLAALASLYHRAYQVSVTVEEVVSNDLMCLLK